MRRQRRSVLASFVYGVVIASGTTAGLMLTHHVLAPPAGDDVAEGSVAAEVRPADGVRRWARQPEPAVAQPPAAPMEPRLVSGPTPATPPAKTVRISDPPPKSGEAQRVLSRNIQRELQRVGCYAGTLDGDWTPATQSAMRAFNDSVRVQLPVTAPDYILLTLLQGHTSRACRPVDPTITAKAQLARPTPRAEATTDPVAPVARPATIAQPRPASQPAPSTLVPPVAYSEPVSGPVIIPSAAPLPGRMAVGAPLPAPYGVTPPVERTAVPPPSVAETVYPPEPPKATERRTTLPRVYQPRRTAPRRGVFSDLSRSAP